MSLESEKFHEWGMSWVSTEFQLITVHLCVGMSSCRKPHWAALALTLGWCAALGGGSVFQVRDFSFSCILDGDLDPGKPYICLRALKGPTGVVTIVPFSSASVCGNSPPSLAVFPLPLKTDFWWCPNQISPTESVHIAQCNGQEFALLGPGVTILSTALPAGTAVRPLFHNFLPRKGLLSTGPNWRSGDLELNKTEPLPQR